MIFLDTSAFYAMEVKADVKHPAIPTNQVMVCYEYQDVTIPFSSQYSA